jgi:5-methylcytosine-specific restriction endonuclease McrA
MARLNAQVLLRTIRQELCDLYPTTENVTLCERFRVSRGTLQRWARQLGLKKSSEHQSKKQRERALNRLLSDQSRAKIAAKAKGRNVSDATKAKQLQTKLRNGTIRRGVQHPNWKGGRPWERYKNPQYLAWRKAVLERDDYICQHCGRKCKKRERGLAAHHIKSYADYPELRYEVSNGMTLCRQCHMTLHGKAPKLKEQIPCACGCGTLIDPVDRYGRSRRYVNGHAARGKSLSESTKQKLRAQRKGKPLTPEHRANIAASLEKSSNRIGRPPKSSK